MSDSIMTCTLPDAILELGSEVVEAILGARTPSCR